MSSEQDAGVVAEQMMQRRLEVEDVRAAFSGRGFAQRTIDTAIRLKIERPETLLVASAGELAQLFGGDVPPDVERYRLKFAKHETSIADRNFRSLFGSETRLYDQTVILAMTARVGSTYLASLLAQTGLAREIKEIFNPRHCAMELIEKYREPTVQGYINAYFSQQMLTGSLILKTAFYDFIDFIPKWSVDRMFPAARFIYIYREDLLAQAYSLWKANVTGVWHSTLDEDDATAPQPDVVAIQSTVNNLATEADYWQKFFAQGGYRPMAISYESLSTDAQAIGECFSLITGKAPPMRLGDSNLKRMRTSKDEKAVEALRSTVVIPKRLLR